MGNFGFLDKIVGAIASVQKKRYEAKYRVESKVESIKRKISAPEKRYYEKKMRKKLSWKEFEQIKRKQQKKEKRSRRRKSKLDFRTVPWFVEDSPRRKRKRKTMTLRTPLMDW